ncbi:MAG: hypothetical protein ACRC2H_01040 [Silanimonas sp.]
MKKTMKPAAPKRTSGGAGSAPPRTPPSLGTGLAGRAQGALRGRTASIDAMVDGAAGGKPKRR